MALLERTAYPQFLPSYPPGVLQSFFVLSEDEKSWVRTVAKAPKTHLGLAVLLKAFQHVRYFPPLKVIPTEVVAFIREQLGYGRGVQLEYPVGVTLLRHKTAVLCAVGAKRFHGKQAQACVEQLAVDAANLMDQRTDIINAMIEGVIRARYELPGFSTLNDTAERVHVSVQNALFDTVTSRMSPAQTLEFRSLLATDGFERRQSEYNDLKKPAKRPTRKHLDLLVEHLEWLESMSAVEPLFEGFPDTKIRHLAEQAMAYDVSELKECVENKRYTLIAALILRMKVRARDQLAEMFLRRIATIHKRAGQELDTLQATQRGQVEELVSTLDDVLAILEAESDDAVAGQRIRASVKPAGGAQRLREACKQVQATSGSNHLPLVWRHFRSHRSILFRLAHLLDIRPTSQDTSLLDALELIKRYQERHRVEWIEDAGDMSFASDRWRKLLREGSGVQPGVGVNRRHLEICVFSYVAEELRSGDLSIAGTEAFADYRDQLLPWEQCEALLPAFCEKMGFASSAEHFVSDLRSWLSTTAQTLDDKFPDCHDDVVLGASGEPVLRKPVAREIPPSAISVQNALAQRMPTRHILDVLANIEHWINFTRYFGPLSGHAAKLKQPAERYLLTIFALGCNLGPSQAARHLVASGVTPHMLSFVNRRHLSLEALETAQRELNEVYLQLELPKIWGDGKTVAADGTQYDFYDENLLAGYHFRYRKMGAVAYRHVANNYIAVFRHFIPPGVWEAIYVIEGLLKAGLSVEADTVHADTQGQSAAVFAFTHLLGIKLMPRIRNWKNLILYRPDKTVKYAHINRLFSGTVNWSLIERHWCDLMQVVLSIHAGRISSATLLRKLGSYSRKNRLYFAAQELGNVIRTGFLLEWVGSRELRQEITANTNKIESYNGFAKWLSFGGDVIAVNEPDEQQKRLRYNDLIASALILQNAVDITRALHTLRREGWQISDEDISFLSPYQVAHIKRFGDYSLKFRRAHETWIHDAAFQRAAAAVLKARRVAAR